MVLAVFFTGLFDPLMWIIVMSSFRRTRSKAKLCGAFLGYYIILIGKGLGQIWVNDSRYDILVNIMLVIYIFIASIILFEAEFNQKIIGICIFFGILFSSEIIIVELYIHIFKGNWNNVIHNQTINLVCNFLSKLLQIVGCYLLFFRKNVINYFLHKQKLVVAGVGIGILIINIMLGNEDCKESLSVIILFEVIEIFFLWYMFCSIIVTKKKNKQITNLKKEAQNDTNRRNWVQDMEHFKQNLSDSIWIMRNLCYHKDYEQLGEFMDEVFGEVDRQELLFKHANISVRILVSELIQKAKEMRIRFNKTILVNEFGMEDEEICSILKNLVMNGLEAATKVPPDIAHVTLQVLPTKGGYEIRCINDCIGAVDFSKTTKKDRNNHGYGVAIVEEIVKRNHGTIERRYTSAEREGMGIVAVSIIFTQYRK